MDRLIEAFQSGATNESVQWLQAALNEVNRQDLHLQTLQGIDLEHAENIDNVCRNIRENPGRKFLVSQLAAKASMCVDHFIRVFKRHKGMTPGDYIVDCRIEAARGLLQSSTHNISQISELLGYANVYAFSKQFKERTGKAPTHYRVRTGAAP
jgi:transcriptional regulator GlxA family with amidase domain